MSKTHHKFFMSIRRTLVLVFILSTTITAMTAIGLFYYFGQDLAKDAATREYAAASAGIANELRNIGKRHQSALELLADNPLLADQSAQDSHLDIFARVLVHNPLFYGAYIGRDDGSFYEVINLDASENAKDALQAIPTDRWVVMTVTTENGEPVREYQYLDKAMQIRTRRSEPTEFDVTVRPWFAKAMASKKSYASEPYLFAQLGLPGSTVSKRIAGTNAVVGLDMTLGTLSRFLSELEIAEHGEIYLYEANGEVVASDALGTEAERIVDLPELELSAAELKYLIDHPKLNVSNDLNWPPFDFALSGVPEGYSIDIVKLIIDMAGTEAEFINGYNWDEFLERFKDGDIDILHSATLSENSEYWGLASEPYATLPYGVVTIGDRPPVNDISQLNGKTLAIPEGWFVREEVRKAFPEIILVEAKDSFNALEMVRDGLVYASLNNQVVQQYLLRNHLLDTLRVNRNITFGEMEVLHQLHILVQPDAPELLSIINKALRAIPVEQRRFLAEYWLDFDSEITAKASGRVPSEDLVSMAANKGRQDSLLDVRYRGKDYFAYSAPLSDRKQDIMFFGMLVPTDVVVGPFMKKVQLTVLITGAFLLLMWPLSWLFANPIVRPVRELARENDKVRRRDYSSVVRIPSKIRELDELSDSMVEMVSAIQAHELAQEKLIDAFIMLIAQAIDDKSPYTGGHCKRVPELALMLAREASNSDLPAFSHFEINSDEEWREYRIAAWLHDCGKITTPEHIVDKGTKLETIYNRIHEVRTRFEVLLRDAHIDYLEALQKNPEQGEALHLLLQEQQKSLREDFEFVAQCNIGGEFFDEHKQQRLASIASKTWLRNFDNHLGLSPVEEQNLQGNPAELPCEEYLLSDKPEHIISRTRSTDYPKEYGINMDVPPHLYNLGELYNLSISRGTLTAEDRFKINEHMISTIKMLGSLPFPDELSNVPRYASTHHETMRGSGYPRKLPGSELSTPERILAVADVFEALTASDRPYKKAKPLSVAIDILDKMVKDEHLDKDCFELFLRSKVFEQYAQRFLPPSQLDSVNVDKYLS